jgi:hypothetical protein
MSRVLAILVAAALAASFAGAGAASAQTQSVAPTTHAGTRLSFPASLGGAQFERSVNYAAPPANSPGQGFSYYYSTPKKMVIAVQVYDGGRRVPSGSDNPTVLGEFASELGSAEQKIRGAGYTHYERPSVPSACTYGAVTFRCITYSALNQSNARIYSKLLLTGYRDHYVKIRIDWGQAMQQTGADADAALRAFIPALLH